MCHNHNHARVRSVMGAALPDGTIVFIADTVGDITLESTYGGVKSTLPSCLTLWMPLQQPGMVYFSPEALMVALTSLLSVQEPIESDSGGTDWTQSVTPSEN